MGWRDNFRRLAKKLLPQRAAPPPAATEAASSATAPPTPPTITPPTSTTAALPTSNTTGPPTSNTTAPLTSPTIAPPTLTTTAPPTSTTTVLPTSNTTAPPTSTTTAPPISTTTALPISTTTAPPTSTTTAPPASTTTTSSPSPSATPASSSQTQPLFPVMRLVQNPSSSKQSSKRRVFVSLSSDLRLIYAKPDASAPESLLDFRNPDRHIPLQRFADPSRVTTPPQSIEDVVKPFVRSLPHAYGPAVRFCCGKEVTILVAEKEDERDAFFAALCQRLAPLALLRERMEAEIREEGAATTSKSSSALRLAARSVFQYEAGEPAVEMAGGIAEVSGLVQRIAFKMAHLSVWTATHGKAIGELVRTAEGVEKLTKPFGVVTVVGCAFSLVSLSAGVVGMVAKEVGGKEKLRVAHKNLQEASMVIVECLFSILVSGFENNAGLADQVFGRLWKCWDCADELEQYLLRGRVGRVRKVDDIDSIVLRVEEASKFVFGALIMIEFAGFKKEIDKRFTKLECKAGKEDGFIPGKRHRGGHNVPLLAGAAIELAQLKNAVLHLDASTSERHAVVSSSCASARGVALVSVDGEGGVGKTSTCKLLCDDHEIQNRFAEGAIIWIEVGKDAAVDDVKNNIALVVDDCGGTRSAQLIRELAAPRISTAVGLARKFFSNHMILLVLDNVWDARRDSNVDSWAAELAEIASFQGSVVLMTTRFQRLAESGGFVPVHVGPFNLDSDESVEWALAEDFYDFLLGDHPNDFAVDTPAYEKERRTALRLSCGIPLGITTIAALVREWRRDGRNVAKVLEIIKGGPGGLAHKFVGEDQNNTVGHRGLFPAMKESLLFLDEKKGCRFESKSLSLRKDRKERKCPLWNAAYDVYPGKGLSSRYAALHMLPESSPTASLSTLSALWHVQNNEEAYNVASLFVDIGLARWQGAGEKALVLHDLQYEFCGHFGGMSSANVSIKGFDVAVNGHALFLSSCESLTGRPSLAFEKSGSKASTFEKGGRKASMWGRFCFNQSKSSNADHVGLREYLAEHLLRHFCSAAPEHDCAFPEFCPEIRDASKREIVLVLSDFCWLRGRFYSLGGRNSLLRDFARALKSRSLRQSDTASLRRLMQCVLLVSDGASCRSDGTLASSLVQMAQSGEAENSTSDTTFFKQLSNDVAEEAIGAWLKPVSGCCLEYERGVLGKAFINDIIEYSVDFVSCIGDGMHFLSLSGDGMVRVHDFVSLSAEPVLEDIGKISFIAVVQQNYARISPIVFSVGTDGAVYWSHFSFHDEAGRFLESKRGFVGNSNCKPSHLFASKNGNFVAAGCYDGSVCVWEPDGDNAGSYVLKMRLLCSAAEAEDSSASSSALEARRAGSVEMVVMSESGHFVAAYIPLRGLYFWKEEKRSSESARRLTLMDPRGERTLKYMFLSSEESSLYVLFAGPRGRPEYEIRNVETGDCRLLHAELPELSYIYLARLVDSSDGAEIGNLLLVGIDASGGGHGVVLVEYSIGDKLEMVRMAPISVGLRSSSFCSADYSDETGVATVVIGGHDGSVHLLGADLFDASITVEQAASCMFSDEEFDPSPVLDWDTISAVAVMRDGSFVVAGHRTGQISLWSAKDGSFDRPINSGRDVGRILCIDIGADDKVAVTGHYCGTLLVWETSTWTVRCALEFPLEGRFGIGVSAAVLSDTNRVVAVSKSGALRVWDTERGGELLWAIETGSYHQFAGTRTRVLVSPDETHFIWATQQRRVSELDKPWQAKVIDITGHRFLFDSDEHPHWEELCAEIDSRLSQTESMASWKIAAVENNELCFLRDLEGKSVENWEISLGSNHKRVQCASRSAEDKLSDQVSITLQSNVTSIAAQWQPDLGEDGRRRAVVACAQFGNVPAIMHFITPKV